MDQYIGKMLDNRYEILERIGSGGMAVVYKAKCHRLNRLVAIKILKSDLAQDADFRRRFNAESQAVAQLSHANIMSIYDVSRGGDIEYIVMELIDGITLKQYMEKRGLLNWRESLHFITQIMRGLSHAHSRGIIHRDIKPQNIMVLRDGSVKVADFGIACLENAAQTLTQEALGSVHYISPEQAKGDRTDARSDIYSAGVVLYEMLTGRLPFEGDNAVSVAIQHLSSIPLAPREINPDIPEQMELICMKAMASERDKRYSSAEAMIADLENFRKNPGVSLDFDLEDLHGGETVDEPTMPLPKSGAQVVVNQQSRRSAPARDRYSNHEDDYEYERSRNSNRKRFLNIALVVVVAVLALALAGTLFNSVMDSFDDNTPTQFVVPNVLGYTLDDANALESIDGIFTITPQEETISSDDYPAGTIARQDPQEGANRKGDNTVIKVWISSGEATAEMPDVKDLMFTQAKSRLKKLIEQYDLVLLEPTEEDAIYHTEIEKDHIIETIPAAGEPLKKGDTIQVILSLGPELKDITVPKFVGMYIDEVRDQLDAFGLVCTDLDIELVESVEDAGKVVWQSLEPLAQAKEGDTIKFQVSAGIAASYNEREFSIFLPSDGRATVLLEVYVGNETTPQVRRQVDCLNSETEVVAVTGNGTEQIRIYFDGILDVSQSHDMQFD